MVGEMNGHTVIASKKITIIDGGFATQLCNHVGQIVDGNPLWSAAFLASNPEAVVKTHLDFLHASADQVMTNTYQASVDGFIKHLGLDEKESLQLIKTAVELARKACDIYMQETGTTGTAGPRLVGSVGPYGASLHDFSEYTGSYVDTVSREELSAWHRPRIQALLDAGVDCLAFETIPAQMEGEVLVELLKEFPGHKAWLSFSCKDAKHTSHGEVFQDAARHCYSLNPSQVVAVGVNCVSPNLVTSLIRGINDDAGGDPIPLIVYPNSGENYAPTRGGERNASPDPERGWWVQGNKCEPIHTYVQEWLDLGVTYIGGCCRAYATDIRNIRTEVDKWTARQK